MSASGEAGPDFVAVLREPRAGVHENGEEELKSWHALFEQCKQAADRISALERRAVELEAKCAELERERNDLQTLREEMHADIKMYMGRAQRNWERAETAESKLTIALSEAAAMREDSARYWWLRDGENAVEKVNIEWLTAPHGKELDAAIDRARASHD